MVKRVLNIFAIQNYPEELASAINHISTNDVVVFENAMVRLKMSQRYVNDKMFDLAIFSEQSDVMILVDKFSKVSKTEVFKEIEPTQKEIITQITPFWFIIYHYFYIIQKRSCDFTTPI